MSENIKDAGTALNAIDNLKMEKNVVVLQKLSQDVTKDATASIPEASTQTESKLSTPAISTETSQLPTDTKLDVAVVPVAITPDISTPAYFMEGELLPWKGRWFRVKLLEMNGERIIGLVMLKPTASSVKRAEREQRWHKQHQDAVASRSGLLLQRGVLDLRREAH